MRKKPTAAASCTYDQARNCSKMIKTSRGNERLVLHICKSTTKGRRDETAKEKKMARFGGLSSSKIQALEFYFWIHQLYRSLATECFTRSDARDYKGIGIIDCDEVQGWIKENQ